MKKNTLLLSLTLFLVVASLGVFAIIAGASSATVEPELSIPYCNLSFRDSVCIKYAVKSNVSDVKLLLWTSAEEEYTVGTHDDEITAYVTESIGGVEHYVFDYTALSAKQMTDVVYARAYAQIDGTDYYSEVNKYSILQYAYNKLGKTGTASTDEDFKEMLTYMLSYGAAAQKYFDYKADRLATANWVQVKVTDGTLDDGNTQGLYLSGDTVTLTAPETDAEGNVFSYWADANGNSIGTTPELSVAVGQTNRNFTPLYGVMPADPPLPASEGLEFTLNDNGESYSVSGIGTCTDTDIIIPATYDGLPVTGVSDQAFYKRAKLTSITIPDSVTTIGDEAFHTCPLLTSVTIGNSVTSIGSYAFYNCTKLTSITIPDSVKYIGIKAFYDCSSLTSVTIGNGVRSIGDSAFYNCDSLTSISIPDSVTSIGKEIFFDCSGLTTVTIGNGVTSIGDYAFFGCSTLTSVIIPDSVTNIGNEAFFDCSSLTSVTIGNGVTEIGYDAFSYCSDLTTVTIGNGVMSIGYSAFDNCSALTSVHITDLAAWCEIVFKGPESNPLYYAHNLYLNGVLVTNLVIPDGVMSIGSYAFYSCDSLTSVTIPDGDSVVEIGSDTFYDCSGLINITLGNSVTSIGSYAFYGCPALTSVTIGNSPKAFLNCTGLTSIVVDENNQDYSSVNGNLYNKAKTKLLQYATGKNITEFIIPDGVTEIGSYAFYNCSTLTSVIIPDSVTSIGSYAFYGCSSLTSVTFENAIGWWVSTNSTATDGTSIDVTDPTTNAKRLVSTYCNYYWNRG